MLDSPRGSHRAAAAATVSAATAATAAQSARAPPRLPLLRLHAVPTSNGPPRAPPPPPPPAAAPAPAPLARGVKTSRSRSIALVEGTKRLGQLQLTQPRGGDTAAALFDGTMTSACGIDTLQGRVRALEGAVRHTPRIDPIASWPVAPASSAAAASNRGLVGTARAPLAVEIETFIRREMVELAADAPHPTPLQMLPIFREAFACLADRFAEYRDVLALIKQAYDAVVGDLSQSHQRLTRLQTEAASMKELYTAQVQDVREKHRATIADLQAQLGASLKANHTLRNTQNRLEREVLLLKEQLAERDADMDSAQERLRLLTSTTREMGAKNSTLLNKLRKAHTQNEHLLSVIHAYQEEMRAHHSGAGGAGGAGAGVPPPTCCSDAAGSGSASPDTTTLDRLAATGKAARDLKKTIREMVVVSGVQQQSMRGGAPVGDAASGGDGGASSPYAAADEDDLREAVFQFEGRIKKLQRANFDLKAQVGNLMRRIEAMQQSREDETLTPRPSWAAASQQLPDFHFNHLQTSQEILGDLLVHFSEKLREDCRESERAAYSKAVRLWLDEENLCDSDLASRSKYFVGRGTGPHVPECLRWHGRVRNKRMRKGDVETLLANFWKDRRQALRRGEASGGGLSGALPMQQSFLEWLQQSTGGRNKAIELAYNIFDVCARSQSDPDCAMFLKIFNKEISEAAIFDQLDMVERLRELVAKHDKSRKGAISRVMLHRILTGFFPAKSTEDMLRLRFALVISCRGSSMVDYDALFAEDDDGNQSRFVELLRRQHLNEIVEFVVEAEEALRGIIDGESGTILMSTARLALRSIDPRMPDERISEVLAAACNMSALEFSAAGEFFNADAEPFLARLRCGVLLKRHTAKHEDSSSDSSSENDDDGDGGGADATGKGGSGAAGLPGSVRSGHRRGRRDDVFDDGFFSEEELKMVESLMRDDGDRESGEGGEESEDAGGRSRLRSKPGSSSSGGTPRGPTASSSLFSNSRAAARGERERESRHRRATTLESEVADALQAQEQARHDELERRRAYLDTFSLFAAHPSAAGAINMHALAQKRQQTELEVSQMEASRQRLTGNTEEACEEQC